MTMSDMGATDLFLMENTRTHTHTPMRRGGGGGAMDEIISDFQRVTRKGDDDGAIFRQKAMLTHNVPLAFLKNSSAHANMLLSISYFMKQQRHSII